MGWLVLLAAVCVVAGAAGARWRLARQDVRDARRKLTGARRARAGAARRALGRWLLVAAVVACYVAAQRGAAR